MTRKRLDPALAWLPARVYLARNHYVYQPTEGGKITLAKITDSKLTVLKRYEEANVMLSKKDTFEAIINGFYKSDSFKELKPKTQVEYERSASDFRKVFGKMNPDSIAPHHVKQFISKLAKTKGKENVPANATANRYKACLQKICSWALQEGKLKLNPCVGVNKLKEVVRDRYITDAEYYAIYNHAAPPCRAAMEIAYLCMGRIGDVISLTIRDIKPEGLYIMQSKTGKKQIKGWSDRLTQAIELTKELPSKSTVKSLFLFNKTDGSKYAVRTIQAQYSKACELAGVTGATFHDLKAKGVSDFIGTLEEKRDAAGHTTIQQTQTYDRKISIVRPVR